MSSAKVRAQYAPATESTCQNTWISTQPTVGRCYPCTPVRVSQHAAALPAPLRGCLHAQAPTASSPPTRCSPPKGSSPGLSCHNLQAGRAPAAASRHAPGSGPRPAYPFSFRGHKVYRKLEMQIGLRPLYGVLSDRGRARGDALSLKREISGSSGVRRVKSISAMRWLNIHTPSDVRGQMLSSSSPRIFP